jgi:hypothetical protein
VASSKNSHPANAAEALERLGRLSLRKLSMEGLLQTVADLTKTVMPGHTEASVTLLVQAPPFLHRGRRGRLSPCLIRKSSGDPGQAAGLRVTA